MQCCRGEVNELQLIIYVEIQMKTCRIYVDVVFNHMAADQPDRTAIGTGDSTAIPYDKLLKSFTQMSTVNCNCFLDKSETIRPFPTMCQTFIRHVRS